MRGFRICFGRWWRWWCEDDEGSGGEELKMVCCEDEVIDGVDDMLEEEEDLDGVENIGEGGASSSTNSWSSTSDVVAWACGRSS